MGSTSGPRSGERCTTGLDDDVRITRRGRDDRHNNLKVREVRGEEEDSCGGGRHGGRGAGGYNEVKIPNEVTGRQGVRNRRRAGGGKADAVDGDDVDPLPLLRRHRHRCATTFSAHRCAAIAAPPRRRQETTTMETTTATTIDDDSDNEGDTDGNGDDGDGNNGNNFVTKYQQYQQTHTI